MEVHNFKAVEISVTVCSEEEKQKWVEEHAHSLQRLFEKWQRPLGIDSGEYFRYLEKELTGCCNDPLRKDLIESIS